VERVAHLRYVAQPGGDAAAREPWRMALAHLRDAGVEDVGLLPTCIDAARRATVRQMIDRRFNTPLRSSVGRLDAVAAICGAKDVSTYEGQAAMWLEALAEQAEPGQ
jgi:hydrogenase maturation protein HypF